MAATQEDYKTFRWPVSAVQRIQAPATDVWETISAPGNLESCHPFCAENPVTVWPGSGSIDEVHYLNGVVYERRFNAWFENVGYDLEIWHRRQRIANVRWRIEASADTECRLAITVCPFALQHVPTILRWVPHHLKIRPKLKSYLQSVVRGFDWYVTKGESVPRNQFGKHPWYSS